MKQTLALLFAVVALTISCKEDDNDPQPQPTPTTKTVTLKVDDFDVGSSVVFQSGFIATEEAAVTLGPRNKTFKITYVKFLFGGNGSGQNKSVVLKIYTDSGANNPDSLVYTGTHSVSSSDNTLRQIDLRTKNIVIHGGGSIRVSLDTGNGLPSVAIDQDGTIDNSRNWIYSGGNWSPSFAFSLDGDFVIRAIIEENL